VKSLEAGIVIVDGALSPVQQRMRREPGTPRCSPATARHRQSRCRLRALHQAGDFVDLAFANVSGGPDVVERHDAGLRHVEIDGERRPTASSSRAAGKRSPCSARAATLRAARRRT